jgi:hypothetical protein
LRSWHNQLTVPFYQIWFYLVYYTFRKTTNQCCICNHNYIQNVISDLKIILSLIWIVLSRFVSCFVLVLLLFVHLLLFCVVMLNLQLATRLFSQHVNKELYLIKPLPWTACFMIVPLHLNSNMLWKLFHDSATSSQQQYAMEIVWWQCHFISTAICYGNCFMIVPLHLNSIQHVSWQCHFILTAICYGNCFMTVPLHFNSNMLWKFYSVKLLHHSQESTHALLCDSNLSIFYFLVELVHNTILKEYYAISIWSYYLLQPAISTEWYLMF